MSAYDLGRRRGSAVRPSPVFLAFVAAAALGGYLAWTATSEGPARLGVFVLVLAGWVVSLCLHEFGHAWLAHRGGDRSVAAAGYLTLNPFKYANPLLSVVLPLVFIALGGIGLPGGAVYLHRHSLRSRARQSWTAAAGPLVNIAFAAVLLWVVHGYTGGPHLAFWSALAFLAQLQVMAALLNLLPIPGLDGYSALEPHLSPETQRALEQFKPYGFLLLFLLLLAPPLNQWFFVIVEWFYGLSDVPPGWAYAGMHLTRFWNAWF